jgi:alginate O-acetyltransferase complex protein AlgI
MAVYAIQIFFDFSGYTDMAIGAGKMLGFNLPENFNFPYISRSITDFWRRWHMSFAAWIKDYIFTPLAFRMRYWGKAGFVIAILVTFAICGMWHGATWNFLLWGAIQGFFLALEEVFLLKYLKKIRGFGILYTLFIILTCLPFFRTEQFNQAIDLLKIMFSPARNGALGLRAFFTIEHLVIFGIGVLLSIPIQWPAKWREGKTGEILKAGAAILLLAVFVLSVMRVVSDTYNPFIYFKF